MKEIKSINNELIKKVSKLKDKKYRDIENRFLVEGYHLVNMAKDYIEMLFVSNEKDYDLFEGVSCYLVNDAVIKKLAQTLNPQGIIGVCRKIEEENICSDNVIMLDNIQDPGNLGTLIRSALAFNCHDIILGNDTVDVYNDKVIRSSQGAIFKVNIMCRDLITEVSNLKEKGYQVFGTALVNGIDIDKVRFGKKNAIILGNEGSGVKKQLLELTDGNIYLKMNKEIDSLNVGVAGSIIMYEITKAK